MRPPAIVDKHLAGSKFMVGGKPTIADFSLAGYMFYPRRGARLRLGQEPSQHPRLDRAAARAAGLEGPLRACAGRAHQAAQVSRPHGDLDAIDAAAGHHASGHLARRWTSSPAASWRRPCRAPAASACSAAATATTTTGSSGSSPRPATRPVGCGFITWSLRQRPELLDRAIARKPKAIFLSFDDPEPFAGRIKGAGIPLFCQLQTRADAERAIDCGADVIVAQGTEGGGHGGTRATLTLVPEIADLHRQARAADAAVRSGRHRRRSRPGGGADAGRRRRRGRHALLGLAGGAGASEPARGGPGRRWRRHGAPERARHRARARLAGALHRARAARTTSCANGSGREGELRDGPGGQIARYREAAKAGDASVAATIVGEGVGLIHAIEPAAAILERIVSEAEALLKGAQGLLR